MTKKNALGRGLGALIEGVEKEILEKKVEANLQIAIESIDANPFQPRTRFDEQALEELANSIKQLGIVQPLTVRETGSGKFQLIAGERSSERQNLPVLHMCPLISGQPTIRLCWNLRWLKISSAKILMLLKLQ